MKNNGLIKANINFTLVSEDDRVFGIEIGQEILNKDNKIIHEYNDNLSDYEFFKTENQALARVQYINSLETNDWNKIGNYDLGDFYDKENDLLINIGEKNEFRDM